MTNSTVIWRGASLLDGAPLVVIASGLRGSSNRKTGSMLQTYILREDVSPIDAVKTGADASICGDCPHRGTSDGIRNAGRTCYVNVGQGPLSVWRAYQRGTVPHALEYAGMYFLGKRGHLLNGQPCIAKGKLVRLGTYGDPAAVPVHVWERLLKHSAGHTGYTHQWRNVNGVLPFSQVDGLRTLCMASADSPRDALEAWNLGWRTFRVDMGAPIDAADSAAWFNANDSRRTESVCPASAEAGKKLTCAQCLACGGADGRRGSIVIRAHGGFAVMANVIKRAPVRAAREA
jgi:hypothetical protein